MKQENPELNCSPVESCWYELENKLNGRQIRQTVQTIREDAKKEVLYFITSEIETAQIHNIEPDWKTIGKKARVLYREQLFNNGESSL